MKTDSNFNIINKVVKVYRILLTICGILTLASVVLRSVLLTDKYYDYDLMLYKAGGLQYLFYGLIALAAAVFFSSNVFIPTKEIELRFPKNKASFSDNMTSLERGTKIVGLIISALCGFFFISTIILQLLYNVNDLYLGMFDGAMQYVTITLALPCAIYFFFIAFSPKPNESILAVLGICVVIWAISHLIKAHLYMSIPLQSPERIFEILSYISIMLYFLQEIRFHLYRQKPTLYIILGFACVFFTLTNALPSLIMDFSSGLETLYNALEVSIALYVMLRLILLCKYENFAYKVVSDNNENSDDNLA